MAIIHNFPANDKPLQIFYQEQYDLQAPSVILHNFDKQTLYILDHSTRMYNLLMNVLYRVSKKSRIIDNYGIIILF